MHRTTVLVLIISLLFIPVISAQDHSGEKDLEHLNKQLDSLENIPLHAHEELLPRISILMPLAKSLKDTSSISYLLSLKASAFYFAGEADSAVFYFKKVASLDSLMGNMADYTSMKNNIAVVYDHLGNLEKAIQYYQENLEMYRETNDTSGMGTTYMNMGSVNYNRGFKEAALNNFIDAYHLFRSLNDSSVMMQNSINIGIIYSDTRDYKKAEKRYMTALDFFSRNAGDSMNYASCLLNLGELMLLKGENAKGIKFLNRSRNISQRLNTPSILAEVMLSLANAHIKLEDYDYALNMADSALSIGQQIQEQSVQIKAWKQKAIINRLLGNYNEALSHTNNAIRIINEYNIIPELPEVLQTRINILEALGKDKEAYQTMQEYLKARDSLLTGKLMTQLAELEYRHQLEEQEINNEALRSSNRIQKLELIQIRRRNLVRLLLGITLAIILIGLFTLRRLNRKKSRQLKIRQAELEFTIEKLRQQESKQKAILSVMPDFIFMINEHETIRKIYSENPPPFINTDFQQKKLDQVLPAESVEKFREAIEKLKGKSSLEVFTFKMEDQQKKNIYEARLVRLPGNQFLIFARDRTTEQSNIEELARSQHELEEASKSKDRFLSILAHDLRGPFNALLGFSSLLHDDYDQYNNDAKRQYIRHIYKSSEQLFHLLVNLLQWTRLQTGKISYSPTPHDLVKTLQGAINEITPFARDKEITIVTDMPQSLNLVHDNDILHSAVINLLSNAIKYSQREAEVKLKVKELEESVIIEITDKGTGIDIENPEELFRIDTQYKKPGTENESGTGLGLILVSEFIKRHQGRIEVDTKKDKGTTFRIIIPKK